MALLRVFRVVCDVCGKGGIAATNENDAFAFAAFDQPYVSKGRVNGSEIRDLCRDCHHAEEQKEKTEAIDFEKNNEAARAAALAQFPNAAT